MVFIDWPESVSFYSWYGKIVGKKADGDLLVPYLTHGWENGHRKCDHLFLYRLSITDNPESITFNVCHSTYLCDVHYSN